MAQQPSTRSYHSPLRARQATETRELVLQALAELVTERGTTEFSVQEVADRAEVSLRTVYRYFPNRQALLDGLTELVDERMEDLREDADIGWTDIVGRGFEGLSGSVPPVFQRFDELEPLSSAMAMLASAGSRSAGHNERTDEFREAVATELVALPADQREATFALVRHLVSSQTWFVLRTEFGLDGRTAGEAVARAVRAILGQPSSRP